MNNEQAKIENWVTRHLKTNFIYYITAFVFIAIFAIVFFMNISNSSLLYIFTVSFFSSLVVGLLTYVLLREYFFLFFMLMIFITPIFIIVVVFFILNNTTPSVGYMLYTNNLTDKCNASILDINKGIPWYTTKGCVLNVDGENETNKENRRLAIKKYIKVGGSGKKWSNTCYDLKNKQIEFNKEYENILSKDGGFNMLSNYNEKSEQYKFIKKVSIFRNSTMNTLSDFKRDVPDININDLFTLCEVDSTIVGGEKVFKDRSDYLNK